VAQNLTNTGLASAILVRYNELAGVLAANTSCLLKAAGVGDETATRKHRRHIVAWCEEFLDPTLEQLLVAADRINDRGDPAAALTIAEHVTSLRQAAAALASEYGDRRIAVSAIQLRVRLHSLMRVVDQNVLGFLAHTLQSSVLADDDRASRRHAS
jgi:hypothetical protein